MKAAGSAQFPLADAGLDSQTAGQQSRSELRFGDSPMGRGCVTLTKVELNLRKTAWGKLSGWGCC